ncbi:MAG: hypothetical protein PVF83_11555 [Anaerolineales bacterium]
MAQRVFGQVAVGIDDGAAAAGGDVLHQAVLQELGLTPPGQADHVGMKLTHLGGDGEAGGEAKTTDPPQGQVVIPTTEIGQKSHGRLKDLFQLRNHLGHSFGERFGLFRENEDRFSLSIRTFALEAALGDHQIGLLALPLFGLTHVEEIRDRPRLDGFAEFRFVRHDTHPHSWKSRIVI